MRPSKTIKKAVILDDDQLIQRLLSNILKKRGYDIDIYSEPLFCPLYRDGGCYCQKKRSCADILITDIDMPNMTGLEFIESQKRKGCKVQNIAIMSGAWQDSDMEHAKKLGCKILQKPFKMDELYQWLDQCEFQIHQNAVADISG